MGTFVADRDRLKPFAGNASLALFSDDQSKRRTVADAIEFFRRHPAFREGLSSVVRTGLLQLPSGKTCYVVCVICEEIGWGVTLPSCQKFRARVVGEPSGNDPEIVDFASILNQAEVSEGVVALRDGRRLRSIEFIPFRLLSHGSGEKAHDSIAVREALLEFIISRERHRGRQFRYSGMPGAIDYSKPGTIDYSKLSGLRIRSLSKLIHEIDLNSEELNGISRQTVANMLRDCGVRIPKSRPA